MIKIKKFKILLLSLFLLITIFSVSTSASEESINLEESMLSTVKIEAGGFKGAGVFITKELILTVNHLVGSRSDIKVTTYNGDKLSAKIVSSDQWNDIAIIKVDTKDIKVKVINISNEEVKLGEDTYAIGHPRSLEWVLTKGIVSNVDQVVAMRGKLQFDGIIHPGNSGGPLLNSKGELIGIVTNILKDNGVEYTGLNFATQIKYIKDLMKDEVK